MVWLTENFRFAKDSGIGRLAAHVNAGEAQAAIELLRSGTDAELEWIEDAHPAPEAASLQRIVDGMKIYVDAARADMGNKAGLFEALGRFRVLCAEREGARGVVEINRFVGQHFRKTLEHPSDPGRPLRMVSRPPSDGAAQRLRAEALQRGCRHRPARRVGHVDGVLPG